MWVKSPLKKETWAPINQAFFSLSFFWMYIMESSLLKSRSLHSVIQVVSNELLCLKYLFAQIDPGHCTSQWGLPNSCLNLEYHQWCNIFHSCCAHSVTAMYIHTSDDSLSLCVCVYVCVALVIPAAELEQLGSYSPGVHGLPHLRWGQSSASKVHSQAWQVRYHDTRHPHQTSWNIHQHWMSNMVHKALAISDIDR